MVASKQSRLSCVEMATLRRGRMWVVCSNEEMGRSRLPKMCLRYNDDTWVTDLKLGLRVCIGWQVGKKKGRQRKVEKLPAKAAHEKGGVMDQRSEINCGFFHASYFLTLVLREPKAHQFDCANWLRISKDVSLFLLVLLMVYSSTSRLLYGSECQTQVLVLQVPYQPSLSLNP